MQKINEFMNINLCQTKSLILKVNYSDTMIQKQSKSIGQVSSSSKKDDSNTLGQSNPFKINIKQIENGNPFQMNLGVTNKSGGLLFARRNQSNEGDNFSKIMMENESKPLFNSSLEDPKFSKNESKMQSHSEQNIKKYKDTLRLFYNKRYWQNVKNMEDNLKRIKKQGSSTKSQEKRICFKANRLPFNRQNKIKVNSYQKLQQHYLIGYSKVSESITIYEMKHPNIKQLKPIIVKLNPQQRFSSSIQYDPSSGRVFLFSNQNQQITVLSTKAQQVICRIKLKYQRNNPFLHLNKHKNNTYLMVIGGYRILNNEIVEGSKYIEIFSVQRWQISLKQVVLRLGIGRISPIVFSSDQANEQSLFIIGGSSLASLNRKKQVLFNFDQDINFSTNKTAVKIDSSFIEQCFLNENEANVLLINNINVQFYNPLQLYGGVVLFRKLPRSEKFQLFLPNKKQIYTIKTLKNDVHIIDSQLISQNFLNTKKEGVLSRSIGYHRGQNNISQLYRVEESGKLELVNVTINQKKSKNKEDQDECQMI